MIEFAILNAIEKATYSFEYLWGKLVEILDKIKNTACRYVRQVTIVEKVTFIFGFLACSHCIG